MLRMLDSPTHYHHTAHETHPAGLAALSAFWSAFREAVDGSRQYRSLRSRGLSHDAAIRHALGIGVNETRPPKPLHFAGRA